MSGALPAESKAQTPRDFLTSLIAILKKNKNPSNNRITYLLKQQAALSAAECAASSSPLSFGFRTQTWKNQLSHLLNWICLQQTLVTCTFTGIWRKIHWQKNRWIRFFSLSPISVQRPRRALMRFARWFQRQCPECLQRLLNQKIVIFITKIHKKMVFSCE